MIKDFIIIGAGLSGLNLAKEIKDIGLGDVLVLEKSRGVGGRMATRRTLNTKFDHGAQFYRVKSDILKLHLPWSKKSLSHQWFVSAIGNHWCSKLGMTSLAKSVAEGVDVALEKQVKSVQFVNNSWVITSDKEEKWSCKNLIMTCPLPQTLKLLESITDINLLQMDAYEEIKKINYTKAVLGLITVENEIKDNVFGYEEFQAGSFFSISNQQIKGVSDVPAYVVTMSPDFSEKFFDLEDNAILEKILNEFKNKYPEVKILSSELKKWRFCKPTSLYENYFLEIASNLFLIGDAFGGSSLLGAVRSSDALFDFLLKENEQIKDHK